NRGPAYGIATMSNNSRRRYQPQSLDLSNLIKTLFAQRRSHWEDACYGLLRSKELSNADFPTIGILRRKMRSRGGAISSISLERGMDDDYPDLQGYEVIAKHIGKDEAAVCITIGKLERAHLLYVDRERTPHALIPIVPGDDIEKIKAAWRAR